MPRGGASCAADQCSRGRPADGMNPAALVPFGVPACAGTEPWRTFRGGDEARGFLFWCYRLLSSQDQAGSPDPEERRGVRLPLLFFLPLLPLVESNRPMYTQQQYVPPRGRCFRRGKPEED